MKCLLSISNFGAFVLVCVTYKKYIVIYNVLLYHFSVQDANSEAGFCEADVMRVCFFFSVCVVYFSP